MERYRFPELDAKFFIHPKEKEKKEALLQNKEIQKLLKSANDMYSHFSSQVVLGSYVRLNEQSAPNLVRILKETCEILNWPKVPELYVHHSYSQTATPCGNENPYIILSDYLLETADEDMWFYLFGNAVTMIKNGHVDISNLANFMPSTLVTQVPKLLLLDFLRIADITSDRGGLLACQSIAAAARCHFQELGMPVSISKKLFDSDERAAEYIAAYLQQVEERKQGRKDLIIKANQTWQGIFYFEGAANEMLREMYEWYQARTGYSRILRLFGRKGE